MTVTCRPTRAVVTFGCVDASVNIEVIELTGDFVAQLVARAGEITPDECMALHRWIKDTAREVGDWWGVTDIDGDDVACVVLV